MDDLGFKQLDLDNWREPDETTRAFRKLSIGEPEVILGNDWMRQILKPNLINQVPIEVKRLFEVARGAFAYGYFFYPLYTLGVEQLLRVSESAIMYKCNLCKAPKKTNTFFKRLNWLKDQRIISESGYARWTGVRKLRNMASHPDDQTILVPGMTITGLSRSAEMINELFLDT